MGERLGQGEQGEAVLEGEEEEGVMLKVKTVNECCERAHVREV